MRPKGVVDGQPVDIPAPIQQRYYRRGDAESYVRRVMEISVQSRRSVEEANPLY